MFPTLLCIFAGSAQTEINKQDVYNTCVYYIFNSIAFFIYPNIYPESYARKGHTAKLAHFKHIRDTSIFVLNKPDKFQALCDVMKNKPNTNKNS